MYFISQKRYADKTINGIYFAKGNRFFVYQTDNAPKGEKLINIKEVMKKMNEHYFDFARLDPEKLPTRSAYYATGREYINGFDERVIVLKNYYKKIVLLGSDFITYELSKDQFIKFYRPTGRINKTLSNLFDNLNFERVNNNE